MDKNKDKELSDWLESLAKGILLGGSLGLIVAWFDIIPMQRALWLGLLAGCLAGITFKNIRARQRENERRDQESDNDD